jgi:tetratricopeptide (TPR) repeat protein
MNRITLLFCFSLLLATCAFAQSDSSNTYAVVIGISGYENETIKPLVYSDKDAQLFSQWLQSKAGGNVPASHIRLLVNKQATLAAIYNAMDWLKEKCNNGDKVYFYFAGHGDLETASKDNKGYLLAYNTPPNNYPNHALALEQLNNDANFLTLQKKAKVILITDACHSGKLAGDFFKGKQWVAKQLQEVLHGELRLTACAANEEAAEGENWGGGRGVFSYYLLMGLYGLADGLKDGTVTFKELQQFIDSSFKADIFLSLENHKQTPLIDGNPFAVMAVVDTVALHHYKAGQQLIQQITPQPLDYIFERINEYPLESILDFNELPPLSEKTFPICFLDSCIKWQDTINKRNERELLYDDFADIDSLKQIKQQLLSDAALQKQFTELFVEHVHNTVQKMINAYLNGEESELEKRQYYYSGARNYNDFLSVTKTALSLIPSNHHLASVLQINLHYLSGVLARMQMATSKKTDSLVKAAFRHQYKTLELEPYAAYVHNELANLYVHQKRFDSAQYHFDMAAALAGTWAIPWSNQIRMNMMLKNHAKAKMALHKADSLQPNLSYVYMNAGLLMEREKNDIEAFSYFLRASKLNAVHYLPFERLGNLYVNAGKLEKANRFFYEAATLKNDFTVNNSYFQYGVELGGIPPFSLERLIDACFQNLPAFDKNDPLVLFLTTIINERILSTGEFIKNLQLVIQQQPNLPFTYHYLGKKLLEQGNAKEAAIQLQLAIQFSKKDSLKQIISMLSSNNKPYLDCIKNLLSDFTYNEAEDYYLLARAYEMQQLFREAIAVYEQVLPIENKQLQEQAVYKNYAKEFHYSNIDSFMKRYMHTPHEHVMNLYENPVKTTSVIKIMKLYEQFQQYEKAEAALLQQVTQYRKAGDMRHKAIEDKVPGTWSLFARINFYWLKANRDLEITVHDFYNRMMLLQPRNYYWKQQAAAFIYQRLQLAYTQIPQEQYAAFTNSIKEFAYPWNTSEQLFEPQTAQWALPLLNDTIVITLDTFQPVQKALHLLNQAQALSPNKEPGFETMLMYADLNSWMGNNSQAIQWYENALQHQPKHTETRVKLARLLFYTDLYTAAKNQLDTLQFQNSIDAADLQNLIFLHAIAGNFVRAGSLINKSAVTNKEDSCRNILQEAQLLIMQKKYADAINLLQKKFPYVTVDTINFEKEREQKALLGERYYLLARSFALSGKNDEAVMNLKKALDRGFCLVQVLKYDPAFATIRKGKHKNLFQLQTEEFGCDGANTAPMMINPIIYRIPLESYYQNY